MKLDYIAELCQNHKGKINNVEKMVEECAYNGATTIKLQYILAKNLSHRKIFDYGLNEKNQRIVIKRPYKAEFQRLKKLELKNKEIKKFIKICEKNKVIPSITCFAREHIETLKDLGFKKIKVASYDCGSFQMIRDLSKKFKNIIVSTGATFDEEIIKTTDILKKNKTNFSLLHCVTIYPTPLGKLNLIRIKFLKRFTKNIGYSDHSLGSNIDKNLASMAAIYFGAKIIERHITIFESNKTKDGPVSVTPNDIRKVIEFSKLSNNDQKLYLKKKGLNLKLIKGNLTRDLSHEELLNRDYYRGRFVSFSNQNNRPIFNWDESSL